MPIKKGYKFLLTILIMLCGISSYAQIILDGSQQNSTPELDYSNPKTYEVGGITSSGNAYFDPRMINFYVGDRIEVPGEKITSSIKRLWNTGLFEEIDISVSNIAGDKIFFDIYLMERSRLSAFGFTGARRNEENEIREKLKIAQGNIVNDNMKVTCSNLIRQYYIEKGYYFCDVTVTENKDPKVANAVMLIFNIQKEKKAKIEKINITGNKQVFQGQLVKAMKETREKFLYMPFHKMDTAIAYMAKHRDYYKSKDLLDHLGDYFSERVKLRIFKASKFNKQSYEDDKIKLIEKYNELGFRDAYITKDTFYRAGSNIKIDIEVNEGKKYYFRNIEFVGNTKYPSDLLKQLLNINRGDVYNLAQLNENLSMNRSGTDISSLYMNDGYLFFYANPVEVLIEQDSIDIEVRIREGKQATYNKIYVTGNTKTNDNVILREVTTIPGQLFNRADIIRTQQVLLSLGYFNQEKMNVISKPNEADGTVDIEYVVEEASSDQLELSAGWGGGTNSFLISAGITFNNFSFKKFFKKSAWTPIPSGDGQRLSLRASTNGYYYQYYMVSFTEPWLGGKKPNSLTVALYYQQYSNFYKKQDTTNANNYHLKILGISVGFAKKLKWPDDYFQMSHTIQYQYYDVYKYTLLPAFDAGYSNNLSYTFTLSRNSVDAPIYPRSGSDIMFSAQFTPPYSLFGPKRNYAEMTAQEQYKFLEFHKWKFNISWFTKIVDNLVLNVRMKTGFMGRYNSNAPYSPFERFYLGGDGLSTMSGYDGREVIGMRGYDDGAVSPSSGGIIYQKFTAELRYPITLNPSATIYILGFVEAGKAWGSYHEYNPFNLYKSAGLGVRLYLPMFGLLGFDWGYGFDELSGGGGKTGRFHISINQSID
jgi:outer membrane protein insertion porin family